MSDDGIAYRVILADGHPGGSAGNGLTVQGFAFRSGVVLTPARLSYATGSS